MPTYIISAAPMYEDGSTSDRDRVEYEAMFPGSRATGAIQADF